LPTDLYQLVNCETSNIHCGPIKTPLFLAATQLIGHFAALPLLLLLLLLFFFLFFFFFFFYVITLLQMTRLLTTFGLVIIRLIIPQITNMLLTLVASSGECGVYITVRCPSVRPSVSAVDSGSDAQLICVVDGRMRQILIDRCRRRLPVIDRYPSSAAGP